MPHQRIFKRNERLLFLKQLIKNPKSLGAIAPSSQALAKLICSHIDLNANLKVVEIGAGTGRFTRTILNNGLPVENLYVIEIDAIMHQFLRENFDAIQLIHGSASNLDTLLPQNWMGNVDVIISGIPMVNLSFNDQRQIIQACFKSLRDNGCLLQFTYGPRSPIPSRKFGLTQERLGHVLRNFPPASVWKYCRNLESFSLKNPTFTTITKSDSLKHRSFSRLKKIKNPFVKGKNLYDKD